MAGNLLEKFRSEICFILLVLSGLAMLACHMGIINNVFFQSIVTLFGVVFIILSFFKTMEKVRIILVAMGIIDVGIAIITLF